MNAKTIILLLFALFSNCICAQVDSTYIVPFDQDLAIKVYTEYKYTALVKTVGQNTDMTFMSNKPLDIGLGFSWKNISLSGSYGFKFLADSENGKTESLDFQYHRYNKNYVWDVYYYKYKGFYTEADKTRAIDLYPDIKVSQVGSFAQYVFNNKKFSYRATFGQSEKQLKSAGSFLLGGGIFYSTLYANENTIGKEEIDLWSFQIGASGGYAYTWVINKNFFISGSLSGGISVGNADDELSFKSLKIYPNYFVRFAAGYNADTWSLGMSYINNSTHLIHTQEDQLMLNSGTARFTFTKRFNAESIFGKKTKSLDQTRSRISRLIGIE